MEKLEIVDLIDVPVGRKPEREAAPALSRALFSSVKADWETPAWFFNWLHGIWNFNLDVCAVADTAKCKRFLSPKENGLAAVWSPATCWMNPPYGRKCFEPWLAKAVAEANAGAVVVALLPCRTGSRWFQRYCLNRPMFFVPGRLRFVGASASAPFDSVVVLYGLDWIGRCWNGG